MKIKGGREGGGGGVVSVVSIRNFTLCEKSVSTSTLPNMPTLHLYPCGNTVTIKDDL